MKRTIALAAALALGGCATMDQHRHACGANAPRFDPSERQPLVVGSWPNEKLVRLPEPDPRLIAAMVEACAQQRAAGEQMAAVAVVAGLTGAVLGAAAAGYARPAYFAPRYGWAPAYRPGFGRGWRR